MNITDQITADQDAVTAAQAALDAANATLVIDQAKLAAIQPHLSLLDQIETELAAAEQGVDATVTAALDSIKSAITPLIQQMRDILTN